MSSKFKKSHYSKDTVAEDLADATTAAEGNRNISGDYASPVEEDKDSYDDYHPSAEDEHIYNDKTLPRPSSLPLGTDFTTPSHRSDKSMTNVPASTKKALFEIYKTAFNQDMPRCLITRDSCIQVAQHEVHSLTVNISINSS